MVVRDIGELVDLVLRHLEPLTGTFVGADVSLEQFECLGGCVTHGTRRYDVRPCARPSHRPRDFIDHSRPTLDAVSGRFPSRSRSAIGVVLSLSYGYFYQGGGWNQNTRLDVIRAVTEHGTLRIDAYAANTATALDSTVTCTPTKRPVSRCSRCWSRWPAGCP